MYSKCMLVLACQLWSWVCRCLMTSTSSVGMLVNNTRASKDTCPCEENRLGKSTAIHISAGYFPFSCWLTIHPGLKVNLYTLALIMSLHVLLFGLIHLPSLPIPFIFWFAGIVSPSFPFLSTSVTGSIWETSLTMICNHIFIFYPKYIRPGIWKVSGVMAIVYFMSSRKQSSWS